MNHDAAVDALSALAHADRFAAFRMLVRAGPDGMASGEIAEALAIPPTRLDETTRLAAQPKAAS